VLGSFLLPGALVTSSETRYHRGRANVVMRPPPIFVVGVPRSGTTLLRMMLDSHPHLMCGPELPWLSADPDLASLEALTRTLCRGGGGAVRCYEGVDEQVVAAAARRFTADLLDAAARAHEKAQWAVKTPKLMLALPFLKGVFPDLRVVHVLRDGRDVALSTQRCAWRRLWTGERAIRNSYSGALRRWVTWIERFECDSRALGIAPYLCRFEQLVTAPEEEMRALLAQLDLEWSERVLSPHDHPHDVDPRPREGIGAFRRHRGIDPTRAWRWPHELTRAQRRASVRFAESTLHRLGYPPTR